MELASSPGHSQILSRSRGENREKAWDHCYVTGRKWWTRLIRGEKSGEGLGSYYITGRKWWTRFIRLRDKIWEWPGNEATWELCLGKWNCQTVRPTNKGRVVVSSAFEGMAGLKHLIDLPHTQAMWGERNLLWV